MPTLLMPITPLSSTLNSTVQPYPLIFTQPGGLTVIQSLPGSDKPDPSSIHDKVRIISKFDTKHKLKYGIQVAYQSIDMFLRKATLLYHEDTETLSLEDVRNGFRKLNTKYCHFDGTAHVLWNGCEFITPWWFTDELPHDVLREERII